MEEVFYTGFGFQRFLQGAHKFQLGCSYNIIGHGDSVSLFLVLKTRVNTTRSRSSTLLPVPADLLKMILAAVALLGAGSVAVATVSQKNRNPVVAEGMNTLAPIPITFPEMSSQWTCAVKLPGLKTNGDSTAKLSSKEGLANPVMGTS